MINTITPQFVTYIPDKLESGVLYISEEHSTAAHLCCCGCGKEVITPLNEAKWRVTRSPKGVSLYPSIGNWNYECQSHYWIRDNRVIKARAFDEEEIALVQLKDKQDAAKRINLINSSSTRKWEA